MRLMQRFYQFLHHTVYNYRLKHQIRFENCYVISIGNISAGGTGKTPTGIFLAKHFINENPLVVLRGYGGKLSRKGGLVSDGTNTFLTPEESGDEALLYAGIQNVRVAIGRSRARVIRKWELGNKLIILDDAFQNPGVYRDHELVLIDATVSPLDVSTIPYGKFREPLDALIRADTILLTRCDQVSPNRITEWENQIFSYAPQVQVFQSENRVEGIYPKIEQNDSIRIGAFSGIANPESFYRMVEDSGYLIEKKVTFKDHHYYSAAEIQKLYEKSVQNGWHWITTEKDFVRLKNRVDIPKYMLEKFHVLKIGLKIKQGRERKFLEQIAPHFRM